MATPARPSWQFGSFEKVVSFTPGIIDCSKREAPRVTDSTVWDTYTVGSSPRMPTCRSLRRSPCSLTNKAIRVVTSDDHATVARRARIEALLGSTIVSSSLWPRLRLSELVAIDCPFVLRKVRPHFYDRKAPCCCLHLSERFARTADPRGHRCPFPVGCGRSGSRWRHFASPHDSLIPFTILQNPAMPVSYCLLANALYLTRICNRQLAFSSRSGAREIWRKWLFHLSYRSA